MKRVRNRAPDSPRIFLCVLVLGVVCFGRVATLRALERCDDESECISKVTYDFIRCMTALNGGKISVERILSVDSEDGRSVRGALSPRFKIISGDLDVDVDLTDRERFFSLVRDKFPAVTGACLAAASTESPGRMPGRPTPRKRSRAATQTPGQVASRSQSRASTPGSRVIRLAVVERKNEGLSPLERAEVFVGGRLLGTTDKVGFFCEKFSTDKPNVSLFIAKSGYQGVPVPAWEVGEGGCSEPRDRSPVLLHRVQGVYRVMVHDESGNAIPGVKASAVGVDCIPDRHTDTNGAAQLETLSCNREIQEITATFSHPDYETATAQVAQSVGVGSGLAKVPMKRRPVKLEYCVKVFNEETSYPVSGVLVSSQDAPCLGARRTDDLGRACLSTDGCTGTVRKATLLLAHELYEPVVRNQKARQAAGERNTHEPMPMRSRPAVPLAKPGSGWRWVSLAVAVLGVAVAITGALLLDYEMTEAREEGLTWADFDDRKANAQAYAWLAGGGAAVAGTGLTLYVWR